MKKQKKLNHSLEKQIVAKGLRLTTPRRVIASVLEKSLDHPDVAEIHARATAIDKTISLATAYRTLKRFCEIGILARRDFYSENWGGSSLNQRRWRFESTDELENRQQHYHLIDVKTGKIIEFESATLDKIQKTIAEKHGYVLQGQKIELYGEPLKTARIKDKALKSRNKNE